MPRNYRKKPCVSTTDWIDEGLPNPIPAFDDADVQAATIQGKLALAVSKTLKHDGRSREEIAQAMSDLLGEEVSKNMLDAYASQARENYKLTPDRLWALIRATGDVRVVQELLKGTDYVVMEAWCEEHIEIVLREKRMTDDAKRVNELKRRRGW